MPPRLLAWLSLPLPLRLVPGLLSGLLSGLPVAPALAGALPAGAAEPAAAWQPVPEAQLDAARGGFATPDGLLVTLSVDRLLSLNGDVVASSRLAVSADGGGLAATALPSGFQSASVGANNALLLANPGQVAGLVLQNSANDQLIRGQTTINATVNTLSTLKDLNFSDSLRQALNTAIVPR